MPLLSSVLVPGPDQVVVRLTGEVDLSTVAEVREALQRAAESGTARVVVDVAQASFWDCSGLHELAVFTEELARAERQCRIVRATPATRRLIGLANYAPLLHLDGPVDDPNIARAGRGGTPAPPVRPPRPEAPARPEVTEHPVRPRRRAFDLLRRTPAAAGAGRRWS